MTKLETLVKKHSARLEDGFPLSAYASVHDTEDEAESFALVLERELDVTLVAVQRGQDDDYYVYFNVPAKTGRSK